MRQIDQVVHMVEDNIRQMEKQKFLSPTKKKEIEDLLGTVKKLPEKRASGDELDVLSLKGYYCDGEFLYYLEEKERIDTTDAINILFEVYISHVNYTRGMTAQEQKKAVNCIATHFVRLGMFYSAMNMIDYGVYIKKEVDKDTFYWGKSKSKREVVIRKRNAEGKPNPNVKKKETQTQKVTETCYTYACVWGEWGAWDSEHLKGYTEYTDRVTGRELSMRTKKDRELIEEHKEKVALLQNLQ